MFYCRRSWIGPKICLVDKRVVIAEDMSSNIVIVRLEITRTYDEVVDYVIRGLKIRPIYGHQGTTFSGVEYV